MIEHKQEKDGSNHGKEVEMTSSTTALLLLLLLTASSVGAFLSLGPLRSALHPPRPASGGRLLVVMMGSSTTTGATTSGSGVNRPLELWRDLRRCQHDGGAALQPLLSTSDDADGVLLLPAQAAAAASPGQQCAAAEENGQGLRRVLVVEEEEEGGGGCTLVQVLEDKKRQRAVVGAVRRVSGDGLSPALSLVGCVEWLVVDCTTDWTMIPLENLVAAAQDSGTRIAVFIKDAAQVQGAAFALDLGVDALVIQGGEEDAWEAAVAAREARRQRMTTTTKEAGGDTSSSAKGGDVVSGLVDGRVVKVCAGGVGDRVCLDLIQLLKLGEGALVGSSAKALCLVQGEVLPSAFVPARPFRINAGPVHSYVLLSDGSTKYLSEVQAGDEVLIVDGRTGRGRGVSVGRCKVESRPTLRIAYTWGQEGGQQQNGAQVFLQQAETVRLVTKPAAGDGSDSSDGVGVGSTPVTSVKAGDVVLLRVQSQGTHIGRPIRASVTEK